MKRIITGCIISLIAAAFLAGCDQQHSETEFYKLDIPSEKTQTIQSMELDTYRSTEQPTAPSVLELPQELPDKLELRLDQCRAMAMENNLDLKASSTSQRWPRKVSMLNAQNLKRLSTQK